MLKQRPTELLAVADHWNWYQSWCFDEAVDLAGVLIQSRLSEIQGRNEESTKRQRNQMLHRILGLDDTQRFADPAKKF
jgi:hypothetical protein